MKNKGYEGNLFNPKNGYTVQVLVDSQEVFKGKIQAASIREAVNQAYSRVPFAVDLSRIEVKIIS
jgi:hypothetical protein